MTVAILGVPYEIIVKKYGEEESFSKRHIAGFCDPWAKEIVLCDMHTYDGWENEQESTVVNCQKENLKHEIIHAFFYESGLWDNSVEYGGAWAKNEEMVDWFAIQGAKIYKAWSEVGVV